jgi:hypothetical protein
MSGAGVSMDLPFGKYRIVLITGDHDPLHTPSFAKRGRLGRKL